MLGGSHLGVTMGLLELSNSGCLPGKAGGSPFCTRGGHMEIFPIKDDSGSLIAFEIENAYISLGKIASLLTGLDGISRVRKRSIFSGRSEVRVQFRYAGKNFAVIEPFGDSSRYWIGPCDDFSSASSGPVAVLAETFTSYKPPLVVKIIGDLVTLKILR